MDPESGAIDRLAEIKGETFRGSEEFHVSDVSNGDFSQKCHEVSEYLNELDSLAVELQGYISRGDLTESEAYINNCTEKYSKILRCAKPLMDELEKMVQRVKDDTSQPLEYQRRSHSYQRLCRNLTEIMVRFDRMKEALAQLNHNEFKRTLEINGVVVNDAEIDRMIENQDFVVVESLMEVSKKKEALRELENMGHIYQNIASHFQELHDLFCEFKLLVLEGQENIDMVETKMVQAQDYVASANVEVKKAIKYKASASKKKLIIGLIVFAIVVVIVIIIVVSVVKK